MKNRRLKTQTGAARDRFDSHKGGCVKCNDYTVPMCATGQTLWRDVCLAALRILTPKAGA